MYIVLFFFNDTATTEIYTLSLHDALPIFIERKFLFYAVLLQDKCGLKLRLFGARRYLHAFSYACSDAVRAEIELWKEVETVHASGQNKEYGVVNDNPLVAPADEAKHAERPQNGDNGAG